MISFFTDKRPSAERDQAILAIVYLAMVAVISAMSIVGLSVVARPLYVLAGLVICYVTSRRSPWLLLSTTLWFWLFTAFIRRMLEWKSGFNPSDFVLATPNLLTIFFLKDIIKSPTLMLRREVVPVWAWTAAVCYGLFNSYVRGDIVTGSISAADWLIPVMYYMFLVANIERADDLGRHFSVFMAWSQAIVVPYAIYQYFLIPDWDATWVLASDLGSIGFPLPMATRIFGTFNNCGFLAIWGGIGILLSTHFRNKSTYVLMPLSLLMIILTLVRSVYGTIALAFFVLALMGKQQMMRSLVTLATAIVCMSALLAVVSPVVVDHIATRFESMGNLQGDESANARKMLWKETPETINENPFGLGIGAIGRGAVDPGKGRSSLQNVDSSVLAAYLALGWVAGSMYLFSYIWIMIQSLLMARAANSAMAICFGCAALVPFLVIPFVNMVGFASMSFWLCIGASNVFSIRGRAEKQASAYPTSLSPVGVY